MKVLKWLGFILLAILALAVGFAVLVAIKVIAILGGLALAVYIVAYLFKSLYDARQASREKAQSS